MFPDLVHTTLDLLLDGRRGIWHLTNEGEIAWADFALAAFTRLGYDKNYLQAKLLKEMSFAAPRPYYSALKTIKGVKLPSLEDALERYFAERSDQSSENEVQLSVERSRA
jgi:dTDP-4-dehydrorhamnose reductase